MNQSVLVWYPNILKFLKFLKFFSYQPPGYDGFGALFKSFKIPVHSSAGPGIGSKADFLSDV
jgi:hypothetical protein